MNQQLVVQVVATSPQDWPDTDTVEAAIRAGGWQVVRIPEAEAVERIGALTASGQEPNVTIIGPGISHAMALARRIRAAWPSGQMLFVPGETLFAKVQQDLRYAPMIGSQWSLLPVDAEFGKRLERAMQSSGRRARLRTTLDRVNLKLQAPRPVDGLEYRKTVISEHYLAGMLQQSLDAIVSLDTSDMVLYWSAGAERLFGLPETAVQTTPVSRLPFWSDALGQLLAQVRGGSAHANADLACEVNGNTVYLDISCSRIHDDKKVFIGTSLWIRDVSERKRLLESERAARHEAERISRMKDEFLAILSHELRTPLSAVIGRAQLLMMQRRQDAELLASLSVIERNARLQGKLIEDLLDVSSIITGKLHLNQRQVLVGALVHAAVESFRGTAELKNIAITETLAPSDVRIQGDPTRLQQVLYNLLSNALKFTPEGGQVHVKVAHSASHVDITVRDTGIGISPDFIPEIFHRFGQEDASSTRRHGGLGLGLSIAQQLVAMHGGTISVASPGRGEGASFVVSLPLAAAPVADLPAPAPIDHRGDERALSNSRILVVEDFADARGLMVDILQAHGATVTAVESAADALRVLQVQIPDLMISDIGMPDMDGYELIRQVRLSGLTRDRLPAIALTAFASAEDRERAILAGFQSHISKPVVVTDLVRKVSDLIH